MEDYWAVWPEFLQDAYMSQDLKKLLGEVIEMHRAELCKMADLIYDFAEKSAEEDRKSTRLNSSHKHRSRMPSSA